MMKAIVKTGSGIDDLVLRHIPIPQIDEDEMLVRVKAIGVGIHDGYFLPPNINYPYTIGIEAAGIIEKTGNNVTAFEVGDRIAFVSMMQQKGGTWAEFAAVKKDSLIMKIPERMEFAEAAAIPVAGNTVLKGFSSLPLVPNDTLFIAGASGAIGTFAIQLATAKGYAVVSSASKKNHEFMKSLGAVKTVDYNDPNWTEQVRQWKPGGVDAALAIQPGTGVVSMDVVKDGGKVIPVSGDQFTPERNILVEQIPHQADVRTELFAMMQKIAENKMLLVIEEKYPFEAALQALKKTQTRHARGKLVIVMD